MTEAEIERIKAECAECLNDRMEFCEGGKLVECEHCRDKMSLIEANAALQQQIAALRAANERIGRQLSEHSDFVNRRGEQLEKFRQACILALPYVTACNEYTKERLAAKVAIETAIDAARAAAGEEGKS